MANNSKFDAASGISNKPGYPSGQRRASMASSLDRSGSFRESTENRTFPAVPSTSRNSSNISHGDLLNIVRGLPFDANALYTGQKFAQQVEVNRLISGALGISPDGTSSGTVNAKMLPSSSVEEIRRIVASIQEGSAMARDRTKNSGENISKVDKGVQNIMSKKRSRSDVAMSDRSNGMIAGDNRSILGGSMGKARIQGNAMSNSFDIETQHMEARTKTGTPNKRIRTSMQDIQMDVRLNALQRPSATTDRDKEVIGHVNVVQPEEKDKTLSAGGENYEKSKMKKKRSGMIKAEPVIGDFDGDRESKRDMQRRLGNEVRSRSSNSHGFRLGVSAGFSGGGKLDLISHQTDLSTRSTPRATDQDNASLSDDRRDRSISSDKERINIKPINKPFSGEANSSPFPVTTTKVSTSVRTPRSGQAALPKSSVNVPQAISNEWELSPSPNNRKRTPSARSSSPPVASWAGQRPQKISRVARRSNLTPPVSSNDEAPASGPISNASPQHVKLKGENLPSAALSESEESGAAEIKYKDKGKKFSQVEEKDGLNAQGPANLLSTSRKNNKIPGVKLEDGVRRQGRTIRSLPSPRSGVRMPAERADNSTAKQVRSARFGIEKTESKGGRPPTKKLSERKAYARSKHGVNDAALDISVETDEGHADLLAAANMALNPVRACSNLFWKQMEPSFRYVSSEDMSYLKPRGDVGSNSPMPALVSTCIGDPSPLHNEFGLTECNEELDFARETKLNESSEMNPLYHRVMAALISEEDMEGLYCNGDEDFKLDDYGNTFEIDEGSESDSWNQQSLGSIHSIGRPASNGYRITATRRYPDEMDQEELDCVDITGDPNDGMLSNFGRSPTYYPKNQTMQPGMACSEFQYKQMSLDERTLLELQSIGIFPELTPDMTARGGESIDEDIMRLEDNLRKEKPLASKLEKSAIRARESQEREIEIVALDKLVGMSYEKYMACFGRNASCGKGVSAKIAKQAARKFVNQTLHRCQKFEKTGESCFSDPIFKNMFHSVSTHVNISETTGKTIEEESSKSIANNPIRPDLVSASKGPQYISSVAMSGRYVENREFPSVSCLPDQLTGKEEVGPNRVKKRELLLDDVGGSIVGSIPTGIKGKRSERDRDGKRNERDTISRNGTAKIGRPSLTNNAKGERKPKVKPKQKTTQLSATVNAPGNKSSENKPLELATTSNNSVKEKNEYPLDNDSEALDFSNLPDDLGGQGEDLASWLNIDEDALLDDDFMGLEIPMDDLSELNMMV